MTLKENEENIETLQARVDGLTNTITHLEGELESLKSGVHRMVKALHKDGYMKFIPFKLD